VPAKNSFLCAPHCGAGGGGGRNILRVGPTRRNQGESSYWQRACALVRRTLLSLFFLVPLALFYANALLKSCASPRSVRSSARFTGDLLKHEDQCHVANRQIAVRVYLLRSLDPAARVRVVASLGEIRLQSNHDSPPRPSTQRLLLKDRGKGV
jgi:hypothetical protein